MILLDDSSALKHVSCLECLSLKLKPSLNFSEELLMSER
jgi:hypothetical protein